MMRHTLMEVSKICFALAVLAIVSLGQTSNGTTPLANKVDNNNNCTMTDLQGQFFNDRTPVCGQGQTNFFNGEIRYVDAGIGPYITGPEDSKNGYELTSRACEHNGTWTRLMYIQVDEDGAFKNLIWNWKFFGRTADCSLAQAQPY